ncbi:MAG: deoxyribonuclease IV [Oscillospiraceae bacterium]|nr:deoxyribonuclease IV [Oscillospiraceae bacterium]
MSTQKIYIGYHVSASGGYMAMGGRAAALGADTFAFFTRNPRGGAAARADPEDAAAFRAWAEERALGPLVAHAPYTLNPCSDKENVREFAKLAFTEDLERMELTPGNYYNFHPGSHVGQGVSAGIEAIAALLNEVLSPEMHTTVLLETMAGKGSEVGGRFEELRAILDAVERQEKMGVCLDTCHIWDGGYDIENDLDGVLSEFDRVIGLGRLRAVHLNNSMNPCGSRKDRHARLREGRMAPETILRVVNHPALSGLPFILETPNDDRGYADEIAWLRAALG